LITRIPNNPLWPLPPDFEDLTRAGQRLARINATRQWLLPWADREQKGIVFARCKSWFEKNYLWDRAVSQFFDTDPLPKAPFHLKLSAKTVEHFRTLRVLPRGSAKTSDALIGTLFKFVTMPRYTCAYSTSTQDLAAQAGARIRNELMTNACLADDFNPEFPGGHYEPRRGKGSFADSYMTLTNGSWLKFWSAGGRQRGGRSMEYWLDDVEYDPKSSTDTGLLRADMERLIFNVIMPMVLRAGSALHIMGTFVSPKSYLYHLMAMEDDGTGQRKPLEPRMEFFERYIVKLVDEVTDANGTHLISNWPHMWPVDDAQREALGLDPATTTCERMEKILGTAVFRAEMQADPSALTDSYFEIKPARDEWWFEGLDKAFATNPRESNTLICWNRGTDIYREPLKSLLSRSFSFVTMDTSFTATSSSDYKVAHVLLYTDKNELLSLDMWDGRTEQMDLCLAGFQLAHKWGCRALCPEHVPSQRDFENDLRTLAREKMVQRYGVDNVPAIRPISIKNESKVSRIMALRLWFEHGLIKIPRHLKTGPYSRFRDQLTTFNPGIKDGGLRNDDHIDTLAAGLLVSKANAHAIDNVLPPRTVKDRILDGEESVGDGVPLVAYLLDNITMKDLMELQSARKLRPSGI